MESSAGVPTLKFADFVSGDATARSDFARALRDAFLDFGFAILEQPPLPTAGPGSIGEVYRAFEHFFALDRREKNKSGGSAGGQRGYTRFGIDQARDHQGSQDQDGPRRLARGGLGPQEHTVSELGIAELA